MAWILHGFYPPSCPPSDKEVIQSMILDAATSVDIKESALGGRGVFATRDIKQGEIVCFFPVHGILTAPSPILMLTSPDPAAMLDKSLFVCLHSDVDYFSANPDYRFYACECSDIGSPGLEPPRQSLASVNEMLHIAANPERDIIDGWVSHLVRDAGENEKRDLRIFMDYYRASKPKMNCMHISWGPSPLVATVATRDIQKGEELFYCHELSWIAPQLEPLEAQQVIGICKKSVDLARSTHLKEEAAFQAFF